MRLLDILFPPRADERLLRDVTTDAFCALIKPHMVAGMRPNAVGLTLYGEPVVRAAIHEAKYHGSAHAFSVLAALLADFLPEHLADQVTLHKRVIVVPVPLGSARRRERGYNQAEEVARRALALLGSDSLALDPKLLTRIRETETQVSLPRLEREQNMRGAFSASLTPEPRTLYVVLDDVLTTGATLGACVEALVTAGASREQILPLALAYQP